MSWTLDEQWCRRQELKDFEANLRRESAKQRMLAELKVTNPAAYKKAIQEKRKESLTIWGVVIFCAFIVPIWLWIQFFKFIFCV